MTAPNHSPADTSQQLVQIGRVESQLTDVATAPKQGHEGSPEAWLAFDPRVAPALDGIQEGDEIIVLTWLDRAQRDVLRVHPRGDVKNPEQGVFNTRSPDRPNPIGLHHVEVVHIDSLHFRVRNLEALDGTPVVDVKPVLTEGPEAQGPTERNARSRPQRRADALLKLRTDIDLWVASADRDGRVHLIPLSYYWDGSSLTVATPRASPTARNLIRAGKARIALGPTRDVLLIDGIVEEVPIGTDPGLEEAHAAATGFDPRALDQQYVYLRIRPRRIQSWREANELEGRWLMREGKWLQ